MLLGACASEPDDRPARWAYIYDAIIGPSCATASCHSGIAEAGGVNLGEPDEAYRVLLADGFVAPGDPLTSQLMYLLRGEGIRRMPPDSPLSEADILLIERWILTEAPRE